MSIRIQPGRPGIPHRRPRFSRLNPAFGVTFTPRPSFNVYGGYTEGSRAPAAVELGCADPEQPCRLPNAMAGDPPLEQVIAKTWEAGVRSAAGSQVSWTIGAFHARNVNDLLFVASEQTGFGYFKNFGETERQGLEMSATGRTGRVTMGVRTRFSMRPSRAKSPSTVPATVRTMKQSRAGPDWKV